MSKPSKRPSSNIITYDIVDDELRQRELVDSSHKQTKAEINADYYKDPFERRRTGSQGPLNWDTHHSGEEIEINTEAYVSAKTYKSRLQ